jgi:hypothetical protein
MRRPLSSQQTPEEDVQEVQSSNFSLSGVHRQQAKAGTLNYGPGDENRSV